MLETDVVIPGSSEPAHCNTEMVVQHMETILTLKSLRGEIVTGKSSLPVSVEAIDTEIENQKRQMEDAISSCGSLEGIPAEALDELDLAEAIEPLPEITTLEASDGNGN